MQWIKTRLFSFPLSCFCYFTKGCSLARKTMSPVALLPSLWGTGTTHLYLFASVAVAFVVILCVGTGKDCIKTLKRFENSLALLLWAASFLRTDLFRFPYSQWEAREWLRHGGLSRPLLQLCSACTRPVLWCLTPESRMSPYYLTSPSSGEILTYRKYAFFY